MMIDKNILGVSKTFAQHGEVTLTDGRHLSRQQLGDTQALLIRSVTKVNSDLLENTAVKFVGSATIGTDHMDTNWLDRQGIHWASAPGCNADAAAQYTFSMMVLAAQRLGFRLSNRKIGIVGYGNVGSRVRHLLRAYGLKQILLCDPPLSNLGQPGLCEMEEITQCDVISLHVPLTESGPYRTVNLIDKAFLGTLSRGTLLINSARGKVVNKAALQNWLDAGFGFAALDVWPEEPDIDAALLGACTVATPHVAGYSIDGKLRGTEMIYREFCQYFHLRQSPYGLFSDLDPFIDASRSAENVDEVILSACPVKRDDAKLRRLLEPDPPNRADYFDFLRGSYPQRRDFAACESPHSSAELGGTLKKLGFN